MKIALVSENQTLGLVPDNYPNMRVEFCWAKILNAHMVHWQNLLSDDWDIIFAILPKKTREYDDLLLRLRATGRIKNKIGIIQEGPIDLYETWSIKDQIKWIDSIQQHDFYCVHNQADKMYLQELMDFYPIYVFSTVYDSSLVGESTPVQFRSGVMLSGNFSSWYGGTFALNVLRKLDVSITIPGSGRITKDERAWAEAHNVKILPWLLWDQWMHTLGAYKLGINLMRTRAAGTFSLNCATLGVPCIGFLDLDTQAKFHSLNVAKGTYFNARNLITKMVMNDEFYENRLPSPTNRVDINNEMTQNYFQTIVRQISNE